MSNGKNHWMMLAAVCATLAAVVPVARSACATNADCDDGLYCTTDVCIPMFGTCTHASVSGCCDVAADCPTSADPCIDEYCDTSTHKCVSTESLPPECCSDVGECPHINPCDEVTCVDTVCQTTPIPDCCIFDLDCDDGDICTTDSCSSSNVCNHVPISESCCTTADDCPAPPTCYVATCELSTCGTEKIPDCCTSASDCSTLDPCATPSCVSNQCVDVPKNCDDGNACTTDTCSGGVCYHAPKNCDDGNPCTTDGCVGGFCTHSTLPGCCTSNTQCSDGNACTTDTCVSNACVHTPLDCDDDDVCTADSCVSGVCRNLPISGCCSSDAQCDDGVDCTADYCLDNACLHEDIVCYDGDPCTDDACLNGGCVFPEKNCDDGDSCTVDSCVDGTCVNAPIPDCCHLAFDCSDGDLCTIDSCIAEHCSHAPVTCDDFDACTDDYCVSGECAFFPTTSCDDDDECTIDTCIDDACVNAPLLCDDENACTSDACVSSTGECSFSPIPGCCNYDSECSDANVCTTDLCVDHACAHSWIENCCFDAELHCDDGDVCTTDSCVANACVHTSVEGCCNLDSDCDDGDVCTADSCVDHACSNVESETCCTAREDCLDGDACTLDMCQTSNNTCTHVPYKWACKCHATSDCSYMYDATKCQCGYCDRGICRMLHTCDDENPRTKDTCTSDGSCVHTTRSGDVTIETYVEEDRLWAGEVLAAWSITADQNAGDWKAEWKFSPEYIACPDDLMNYDREGTITATQMSCPAFQDYVDLLIEPSLRERGCGWYQSTVRSIVEEPRRESHPPDQLPMDTVFTWCPCSDDDPCTVDTCNPDTTSSERCLHFAKNCDDGDECTDDICVEGACVHENHTCVETDPETCTEFECFYGDGLCYPSVEPECEPPTVHDACLISICEKGVMTFSEINCTDDDPCTIDTCQSPLGVCNHTRKDCADGLLYTYDFCDSETGECMHYQTSCIAPDFCHANWTFPIYRQVEPCVSLDIDCDDNDPCTTDGCDPLVGCTHDPVECPTENKCVIGICNVADGECAYVPVICTDGNPCTRDSCDSETGECVHADKDCSDDDVCTNDICNDVTGECFHVPLKCNDYDACTIDECVDGVGCVNTEVPCMDELVGTCMVKACDHITGEMSAVPRDCNDGDLCTVDTCHDDVCYNEYPEFADCDCVPSHDDHHHHHHHDHRERFEQPPTQIECVPFPEECLDGVAEIDAFEPRHHHEDDYQAQQCRDWDCMEYVCNDSSTGAHTWVHRPYGSECNEWDACHRFQCDGCGFCVKKSGAPDVCMPSMPWWIILIIVFVLLFLILLLLVIVFAESRRRDEEMTTERYKRVS